MFANVDSAYIKLTSSTYVAGQGAGVQDGGRWYWLSGSKNNASPDVGKSANSGGDTTGSARPAISVGSTGSGSAFSVLSAYYTVHMWLRLS